MAKNFIALSVPHMTGDEQFFMGEPFEKNWISHLGETVDSFEVEFAKYLGVSSAFATHSGTAAIHLALRVLDIKPGDVVFCSSLTFIATLNPILYQYATPVFIDSEPSTWNMSPAALERALEDANRKGKLPKAILVADIFGQSAAFDEIGPIAEKYGVPIVEDACESLGASYNEHKSGTFGVLSAFSFSGNKMITTSAGGMLVSKNLEYINRARWYGLQARDPGILQYSHGAVGNNYRLSNILAGIGRAQLRALDLRVSQRRAVFDRYVTGLSGDEGISFMPEPAKSFSSRWLSVALIDEKTGIQLPELIEHFRSENIETRRVFWPMHHQPIGKGYDYFEHSPGVSISDGLYERGICLPSSSSLSEEDQNRVIEVLRSALSVKKAA